MMRFDELTTLWPPQTERDVREELNDALAKLGRKIIVLDDDPTGTQTVHDIMVYTRWDEETFDAVFADAGEMCFVLTNSRAFSEEKTREVHAEIAKNICRAAQKAGREFLLISRGDSTLRGHFPLETETLRRGIEKATGKPVDGEVIAPFFLEGGRLTFDDVHYVKEGDALVPAGETDFARDKTFGYTSSHLGQWVQEKSGGAIKAEDCIFISLKLLRKGSIDDITALLAAAANFQKIIVNAISPRDIEVFCLALTRAVAQGKEYLFRSAAALPKALGRVSDIPLLTRDDMLTNAASGGLVIIGSHVKKTMEQFASLEESGLPLAFLEFKTADAPKDGYLEAETARLLDACRENIAKGTTCVVFTTREYQDFGMDAEGQLAMAVRISQALTNVVAGLDIMPSFLIAKGGITSSDVAVNGLGITKAKVLGQAKPGVPVWQTAADNRFPRMPYIVFPGNVGTKDTLRELVEELM